MDNIPLCIYHANCIDGFAAAWVVRKAFRGRVDFHPGKHGDGPPDCVGRDVILVDFSYTRQALERMVATALSVTIIDHHVTAQENLKDLHGAITVFDMERCGAMLAWRYFFPNADEPKLLRHIQDRDLWRFVLEGSREIAMGVFSHPYDFDLWDDLMRTEAIPCLRSDGEAILRKMRKDVTELLPQVTRRLVIGGVDVPAANLPYTYASDAGHLLAIGEPFAATYFHGPNGIVFSLRSSYGRCDVGHIASLYGGGGHRHAAGFRITHIDQLAIDQEQHCNAKPREVTA